MKLRKSKWRYKAPPIGQILHVYIDERHCGGFAMALTIVEATTLMDARNKSKRKMYGRPVMMAHANDQFFLFPTPDSGKGELRVRYYPPMMET